MPFLQTSAGGQIWYQQQGSGRTLLLIHGWCMSSAVWKFQQEVLASRYHVVTFDLRGHGRSTVPTVGMGGFDGYAADLVELVQSLAVHNLVVVGWSLGAQVLLRAYAELENLLSGLVLVGATPRFTAAPHFPYGLPSKEAEGMRLKVRRNLERALSGFHRQLFVEGEVCEPQQLEQIAAVLAAVEAPSSQAALDGLDALMTAEMLHESARISCPVLLLHGEQDGICLPQASSWLAQAIPHSRRIVYPACGHAPFLSRPCQFNNDLSQFVEGLYDL